MKQICKKELCTGCTACANICSHGAISMQPDECGYLHPIINQTLCVDCGLCTRVCPVCHPQLRHNIEKCYAAVLLEENELLSCSSGGVATALARHILEKGGIVYGCSAKDITHVCHKRIGTADGTEELKGSKYVQSDLGDVYKQIKTDLRSSIPVLFIGTPCQVAGLYGYLRTDYDNLYTADLVCHGVPSQKMLNENIAYYPSDGSIVSFRRKKRSSKGYKIEFGLDRYNPVSGKNIFSPYNRDFYMFGFLRCLTFRENCYTCAYANNKRVADITLCDFWGLSPNAGFELGKGVSAILVSTKKGKQIVEAVRDSLNIKEREVAEATRWNDQLNRPSTKPKRYEKFIELYSHSSFRSSMMKAYYLEFIYDRYIHYKNRLKKLLLR